MTDDEARREKAYFWESGNCLRNKLGIKSRIQLEEAEYRLRTARQAQLDSGEVEVPRTFDQAHLRAIHRHLLQDVYDWAGEFRDVVFGKQEKFFAYPEHVDELLDTVRERMIEPREWSTVPRSEFVLDIAKIYCHQNFAHPFREGNGATSKVFLAHVAEMSRYRLDFDRVDKAEWNAAAYAALPHDPFDGIVREQEMYDVFDKLTVDREPAAVADPGLANAIRLQTTAYTRADGSPLTGTVQPDATTTRPAQQGPASDVSTERGS
ncbi:Fic family protein [Kribbella solani]|uniref:Fic/DOC family protein n=1 Tax=Kribbella solani TaxID=236067 RepID=UPI00299FA9EF|nr:Fic family protein [Kribbella solani]MDX3001599.1 Fic family protein [Kribbella solani]